MDLKSLKIEEEELNKKLIANREKQKAINADAYSKKHNIYPFDKFNYTNYGKTIKVMFVRFSFMNNEVWCPVVNPMTVKGKPGTKEIKVYDITKLKKIIQ